MHTTSGGKPWTVARVKRVVRARIAAGESLESRDAPVPLIRAGVELFGTWRQAVASVGAQLKRSRARRGWDEARIAREILRRGTARTRKSAAWAKAKHYDLYGAAETILRNWKRALELAGLDPSQHTAKVSAWTPDACARYVRARIRDGVGPSTASLPPALYERIRHGVEGGWPAYLATFGATPKGGLRRRDWSKDVVIREIRSRRAAGRPIHADAVCKTPGGLWPQARKRFGSWDAALEAAGVPPLEVRRRRTWTREDVLDALRERARRRRSLHYRAVARDDSRLYGAVRRLLPGAWAAALAEAGLPQPRRAPRTGRKK